MKNDAVLPNGVLGGVLPVSPAVLPNGEADESRGSMPREWNDIMELLPEGELQWKAQSMPQSLAPTVRVGLNRGAVICPFQGRFRWCRGVPGVGTPGWHVSPRWGGGVYRWTKRTQEKFVLRCTVNTFVLRMPQLTRRTE